jgi:tetratricopeptide (TPR) repeat protein
MHSIPLEAEGLGTPVGEYRPSWQWPLLGWGGGAAACGLALWFSTHSPTGTWWTTLLFGGLGLVLLGVTAYSVYAALTERVLIYSAGLFHQRRRSGERFAWADIRHIERELSSYQGIGEISIKLTRSDDEEFELSGSFVYVPKTKQRVGPFQQFSLIDAVISIEEAVQSALSQKAIKQYESGAMVDFNDVLVNQRGVQTKDGSIDWPAVADIEYQNGEFRFFGHSEEHPHLIVLAKTILNPFVFASLLHHIGPNRWTLTTRPDPVSERASVDAARRRRRRSTLISWVVLILLFGGQVGYGKYKDATSRPGQLEHAQNLYADQRYSESIAVLDPLIAQEPGYVRGYIERGRAYQKLGQFDQSLSDYQQALILKPGYWYAIYNRGRLYDDMGRSDEALRDYTQAIALKPDSGNMYYRRGSLYARLGMKPAAISDLETYLTFPDDLGKHAEARQTLSELRR